MTVSSLLLLSLAARLVVSSHAGNCASATFDTVLPDEANVESIKFVSKGENYGEGAPDVAYPSIPADLPELCAVIVNVTSSPSSFYRFGLFLPTDWNSRYLEVGNGGFAGGITWTDMGVGARYGFATASTDTGHNSTAWDLTWALNRSERVTDWGWRAIHGTAVIAKAMTDAYYGDKVAYSYYAGCSTGGRQGLREAQLYPDTFDGLLVGAPAWWTAHLQPWSTWLGSQNLPLGDPRHIDISLLPMIAAEVLEQCDDADGLKDGIISAPDLCDFNYDALSCYSPKRNLSACLSDAQIGTLRKVHGAYFANGVYASAGMEKGSEAAWDLLLGATGNDDVGPGYERYFLFNNLSWHWPQYNDSIISIADRLDPGNCTADDFDMSPVNERGGKIILYQGYADGAIPTGHSRHFFKEVAAATGGVLQLRDWMRYFLVPGMGHCSGTTVDAPWYFAGATQASSINNTLHSVPGYSDPQHDILMALMDWVENGTVVEKIVATTWKNSTDPSSGVLRQRPICPYPQSAYWDQKGDIDEASSWQCL